MNPNELADKTGPTYGSIAYHYQYGRHQRYGNSPAPALYGIRPLSHIQPRAAPGEVFAGIDDGPQTVEQLIDQGYFATPRGDPDMALLGDKKHTAWMGLDDILGQVRQRHEIYKQNVLDLLWGECYAFNELARTGWPATNEQQAIYQRRLQDLHGERRAERVTLWRDVSRLREQLPEAAQQYLSAFRKLQILDDDGGD